MPWGRKACEGKWGATGGAGPQGTQGPQGVQGPQGPQGSQGPPGAIQVANWNDRVNDDKRRAILARDCFEKMPALHIRNDVP